MKTANQIKSEFESLASGHYQIHSFLYAQEFEQQAYENLIYPLMLVYPLGGGLQDTTYTRNYRVIIADRVLKSEGNELEVESDTQLICLDILAYWKKLGQNERFTISSSETITPFWEKWGDEVTGHFVDIGIEMFYDFNSCSIPMSGTIPSPPNPCLDARILVNSVVYGNAPSNGNFNVVVKNELGALVGSLIGSEWIVDTSGGSCPDSSYQILDADGNVLYTGTIPSGGSLNQTIQNSTFNVNNSLGTLISSESVLAESIDSYNVADSVAVIKDSANNTLKSENILATASENITINDSVAVIKDSLGTTLKTENILAEATENITITNSILNVNKSNGALISSESILAEATDSYNVADSIAVIKDASGTTLFSENILATESENITIGNSTAIVKDSSGNTLFSQGILAQASGDVAIGNSIISNSDSSYVRNLLAQGLLTLPDSQINVNSVDRGDVVSVKTIDVNLEDSLGAPVVPTSVGLVGNTLTIEVPSGGGGTLLLDIYPYASGAYSLRLLRTDYSGNCVRVRRSSDNTEQDFGFVSGYLDTASMLTFVGANNGFVTTWYDQSGEARNAVQTTAANQPQIVSSGATIDIGGKPSIKFDGVNDQLVVALRTNLNFIAVESVQKINTTSSGQMSLMIADGASSQLYIQWVNTASNFFNYYRGTGTNTAMSTNQILLSFYMGLTTGGFYENGASSYSHAQVGTIGTSGSDLRIGSYLSSLFSDCNHQELVIWEQNQTTRRTDIQTDIIDYYVL